MVAQSSKRLATNWTTTHRSPERAQIYLFTTMATYGAKPHQPPIHALRLPLRSTWDLHSSGILRSYSGNSFGTTYRLHLQGARSPRRKGPIGCPETSAALSQMNSDLGVLYKRYRGQFAQMQCIQSVHLINYYHFRLCYKWVELYLHFLICIRGIK